MDQLQKLLASLSLKQRISIGAAVVLVIGGLFALSHWNRERDFKPLYSGLSQEDAAAVLAKVKESATEYRLEEGGTSILVPSAKVSELRLLLASAGIPKSGRIGFELFDKTNLGVTEFTEQLNYHRALEGELERTVTSIGEVEQARVHITFPKESIFADNRQPAKASVLLKLKPGSKLSPSNVAAICQLIASAVEGLAPDAVSIVDMRGTLLSRPRKPSNPESPEPDEAMLDYRNKLEKELILKINATLEPLLGPEKFRAGISIECDFTSGDQSEETFNPDKSVMVTSQKTEDISGSNSASGVPGTPSNLPRPTSRPGQGGTNVARRTENISYQSSRMVRRTRLPQGAVKRVSVAILLDNDLRFEGHGPKAKKILEPPSPERIKAIHDLVAGVIGFSSDRGDQLVIESQPFEATLNAEPPPSPTPPAAPVSNGVPPWLVNLMNNKIALGAGAAGTLVLLVGIFFGLRMIRRRKHAQVEMDRQLEAGEQVDGMSINETVKKVELQIAEQAAARERSELEALNALKLPTVTTKKAEVLTKHLNEEAKKDPKVMAQIIRSWIHDSLR